MFIDCKGGDQEVQGSLRMEFVEVLQWIEAMRKRLDTAMSTSRTRTYPAQTLVTAVLLSSLIKQKEVFGEVAALVQHVKAPGLELPLCEHVVQQPGIPSGTTLVRAAMALNLAFVLFMRERAAATGWARHISSDSSPQCKRNWLMSEQTWIRCEALLDTYWAATRLALAHPDGLDDFESQDLDLEDRSRLEQLVKASLVKHKGIPVALGAGRAHLQDKVAAFIHAEAMESSSRTAAVTRFAEIVSWTARKERQTTWRSLAHSRKFLETPTEQRPSN